MRNPFKFISKKKGVTDIYSLFRQNDIMAAKSKLSPRIALDYNQISLYINKGFQKRAEKVSEIEFALVDRKGNLVKDNEQLEVLRNPDGKNMTGRTFWRLATQYHDITGMAVMRKITNEEVFREDKKIIGLQLLNSAYIEINEDTETGKIKSFTYSNPVTKKVDTIPFEECIYWYIPDPTNFNQPLPLLLAGLLSIQTSLETEKQYNATMKNGGSIDGLFRFKEGLNAEQVDTLKRDYAQLLRDNKDQNVPLILGGDASFERVALSPQELQATENKKMLLEDLLAVTGVPKSLLGIASGETYANAETSYRIFLRETIKPLMEDLADVLNWKFINDEYDLIVIDPTPENIEENLKKLEVGSRVQAITLNEKRELLGLEPVDGGDEVEKTEVPEPVQTEEKKKIKNFNHPLKDEGFRQKYYEDYIKALSTNKKEFKKVLLNFLDEQKKRVLENISSLTNAKAMTKENFVFDVLDEPLEVSYMTPVLRTMEKIAQREGEKTARLFKEEFYYTSEVDKVVEDRFNFFAKSINATTGNVLKAEFSDWFKNGETVAQLSERVSSVYDFEKTEKWRADMIVNTEVSTIANLTKGETYKQLNIPIKIWVHRAGIKGGVRDEHSAMDGEERKINEFFSNGLKHPHDPAGGGGDNINCNCTW